MRSVIGVRSPVVPSSPSPSSFSCRASVNKKRLKGFVNARAAWDISCSLNIFRNREPFHQSLLNSNDGKALESLSKVSSPSHITVELIVIWHLHFHQLEVNLERSFHQEQRLANESGVHALHEVLTPGSSHLETLVQLESKVLEPFQVLGVLEDPESKLEVLDFVGGEIDMDPDPANLGQLLRDRLPVLVKASKGPQRLVR